MWIEPGFVPHRRRPSKAGQRDANDHLGLDELLAAIGAGVGLEGPYLDGSQEWVANDSDGLPAVRVVAGTVDWNLNRVAWIDHILTPVCTKWGADEAGCSGDPWESVMVNVAGPDLPAMKDESWYPPYDRLPQPPGVSVHLAEDREDMIAGVHSIRFVDDTLLISYWWCGRSITCQAWLPVHGRRKVRQKWMKT